MGEHSAPRDRAIMRALTWAREHRRTILTVAVMSLPIVSRYVPAFPTAEVVNVLRLFLGAA